MDDVLILEARMKEVFGSVFNLDRDEISPEISMQTFGAWDSLRQIQLVLALEDEFKVSFSEKEVGSLSSFTQFFEALRKRARR